MDSLTALYYTNVWLTSEICKKLLIGLEVEIQQKSRKIWVILGNCGADPLFEKYPTGIFVFQHYITGTANEHGDHT
jgi:hypothetical protein